MSLRSGSLAVLVVGLGLAATGAAAQFSAPFAPPAAAKPKVVRLLAFAGFFEPHALEAFEQATGYAVAYDSYALAVEIADKWKDGPYDVVVLPGPALARRIASGALARLDRRKLPHARATHAAVDAKLAAYDPGDAFSAPFGWAPYGLIFDGEKVPERLGGSPSSWSALLDPRVAGKLSGCGVATPNARDAMFVAAWRLMGVDPARLRALDIRSAGALMGRAKPAMQSFALSDPVGAIARGTICLTAGTPGEAAAANERAKKFGAHTEIGFVLPKEGGAVEIDAFAIPRDAPNPEIGYKLIDFLLTPEIAGENTRLAGLESAENAPDAELWKRLSPLGAFDDGYAQALEAEWTRLRTSK